MTAICRVCFVDNSARDQRCSEADTGNTKAAEHILLLRLVLLAMILI